MAETVGLSLKELKLSDSNDDKSTSILVALKKLKPNAEGELKEAFEKEIYVLSQMLFAYLESAPLAVLSLSWSTWKMKI